MSRARTIIDAAMRDILPVSRAAADWAREDDQSKRPDIDGPFWEMIERIAMELPSDAPITRAEINDLICPLLLAQTNAILGYSPKRRLHS